MHILPSIFIEKLMSKGAMRLIIFYFVKPIHIQLTDKTIESAVSKILRENIVLKVSGITYEKLCTCFAPRNKALVLFILIYSILHSEFHKFCWWNRGFKGWTNVCDNGELALYLITKLISKLNLCKNTDDMYIFYQFLNNCFAGLYLKIASLLK